MLTGVIFPLKRVVWNEQVSNLFLFRIFFLSFLIDNLIVFFNNGKLFLKIDRLKFFGETKLSIDRILIYLNIILEFECHYLNDEFGLIIFLVSQKEYQLEKNVIITQIAIVTCYHQSSSL